MIVDCAVYEDGSRCAGDLPLADAGAAAQRDGSFVWIGVYEPSEDEFDAVRREFDLHELAVEDAIDAHQRPKVERYGDTLLVVLKTVRYAGKLRDVETGEILLFVNRDFVVSVRHGQAALHDVRLEIEKRPDLLRYGSGAVLYAIVDRIVDDYEPVVEAVESDIQEVEHEVFAPTRSNPAERIYTLEREVLDLHRAIAPLSPAIDKLARGQHEIIHPELRTYFRDVHDHLLRVSGRIDGFRDLLSSALQANLTQAAVRQNEDMRKISAWVAILAVPTGVAAIYGMNFDFMPELEWRYGYPVDPRHDRRALPRSVLALPPLRLALRTSRRPLELEVVGCGALRWWRGRWCSSSAGRRAPTARASGAPAVVALGDSAISGEAGRWAGNTNSSSSRVDALGSTAYHDVAGREAIAGCHRSKAAEVHIGGGVLSANLACSGARTYTRVGDTFKPGIDFYSDSSGRKGQALALQEYAATHNVKAVALLIGANNYGFADIVQACVTNWLTSPSWWKNYCYDDSGISSRFTAARVAHGDRERARRDPERGAGDDQRGLRERPVHDPRPDLQLADPALRPASAIRETGWTRQSIGGCGVWNRDADWAQDTVVTHVQQHDQAGGGRRAGCRT